MPNAKIRGSFGNAFRAPSFLELYSNFPIPVEGIQMVVEGNDNLKPETSQGGNIGFEYLWNDFLLINSTYFHNKFEDLIVDYQKQPFPRPIFSYLNVRTATFQGVELQTRFYILNNLNLTLSYNYTDIDMKNEQEMAQGDDEEIAFSKISPHTASSRLIYRMFNERFKISLRNQYFSQRDILVVEGHSNYIKQKKDAYNVVDLTFMYDFNKMLTFRLGGTNLTDYKDDNYGPFIGRRIFFGVKANF
jgi:outer membrane receptor for ferrienterochelin and colicin